MADSGIRTRQLWLPNRGDAHTYVIFKALTALQNERADSSEKQTLTSSKVLQPTKLSKN